MDGGLLPRRWQFTFSIHFTKLSETITQFSNVSFVNIRYARCVLIIIHNMLLLLHFLNVRFVCPRGETPTQVSCIWLSTASRAACGFVHSNTTCNIIPTTNILSNAVWLIQRKYRKWRHHPQQLSSKNQSGWAWLAAWRCSTPSPW